jgi:hypothetical protein
MNLLPLLFLHPVVSDLTWIPAEGESLPMSRAYRDSLRERLDKIDLKHLPESDRNRVERLKRQLDPETHTEEFLHGTGWMVWLIGGVVAVVWWYRGRRGPSIEYIRQRREEKYNN